MKKDLNEVIKNKLFQDIENNNLSEAKINELIGKSKNTLWNWKKKFPENIVNYFQIYEILGKSFESFFNDKVELGETETEILELFSKIENEKDKIKVLGRLEELVDQLDQLKSKHEKSAI